MTERQVKIRMTKLDKLIHELDYFRDTGDWNTKYADVLKEKINKIQTELLKENELPLYPAYIYDTESGEYKEFEKARLDNGR